MKLSLFTNDESGPCMIHDGYEVHLRHLNKKEKKINLHIYWKEAQSAILDILLPIFK